jgi:hypothetical protein
MKVKVWHKVIVWIVTPTVLVGAYYGGKYAIKAIKKYREKNKPADKILP